MSRVHGDPTCERGVLLTRLAGDYLASLLDGDLAAAQLLVTNALLCGVSPTDIYQRLVGRALQDVGLMWELDELTIADEHMASEISAAVLASLWPTRPASREAPSVVVACLATEGHSLGAAAFAAVLAEHGWNAVHLGPHTPSAALLMLVEARSPDLVALSVKLPAHLEEVGDVVRALKALPRPPAVLVGGAAVAGLATTLGADAVTDDLAEALAWADERLSRAADQALSSTATANLSRTAGTCLQDKSRSASSEKAAMEPSTGKLWFRLECETCRAAASQLGRCSVCCRGYVTRVASDRPLPQHPLPSPATALGRPGRRRTRT